MKGGGFYPDMGIRKNHDRNPPKIFLGARKLRGGGFTQPPFANSKCKNIMRDPVEMMMAQVHLPEPETSTEKRAEIYALFESRPSN